MIAAPKAELAVDSTTDRKHGRSDARDATLLFGATLLVYLVLRSRFYIGDGIRYVPWMLWDKLPPDHGGNGHFLNQYVGWAAYRIASALGVSFAQGDGPIDVEAIGLFQGVNAVAGALGIALLFRWVRGVASRRAALIACAIAALSNAYLLHATDMTEPIGALPMLLAALLVLQRWEKQPAAWVVVGVLFGLAADFYQVAVFSGAAATWLAVRPVPPARWPKLRDLILAGLTIGIPMIVTYVAVIVVIRNAASPSPNFVETLATMKKMGDNTGMFGSFSPKHFATALVFGFSNSLTPLPEVGGMSKLLYAPARDIVATLGLTAIAWAFLLSLATRLMRTRKELVALGRSHEVTASVLWIALVFAMAGYWSPLYEKFWVFSVPPFAMLVALAIEPQNDERREGPLPRLNARGLGPMLGFAAVALVAGLVRGAMPRRFGHNTDVDVALRLAQHMAPADLLVVPGWDNPSNYLRNILRHPLPSFDVTDETIALQNRADLPAHLAGAVAKARAAGGHVYFFGLVDMSKADWDVFFGSRLGIPYSLLEPYRGHAKAIDTLPGEPPPVLYELTP